MVERNGSVYTRTSEQLGRQRKIFKKKMAELSQQKLQEMAAEEAAKQQAQEEERKRLLEAKVERRKEHVRQRILRMERALAEKKARAEAKRVEKAQRQENVQQRAASATARQQQLIAALNAESGGWLSEGAESELSVDPKVFLVDGASTGYRTTFTNYLSRYESDLRTQRREFYPLHSPEQVLELLKMHEYGLFDGAFQEDAEAADLDEWVDPSGPRPAPPGRDRGAKARSERDAHLERITREYGHLAGELSTMSDADFDALLLEMFDGMPGVLKDSEGRDVFAAEEAEEGAARPKEEDLRDARVRDYEARRFRVDDAWNYMDREKAIMELHVMALDEVLRANPALREGRRASQLALERVARWLSPGGGEEEGAAEAAGWNSMDGPEAVAQRVELQSMLMERKVQERGINWGNSTAVMTNSALKDMLDRQSVAAEKASNERGMVPGAMMGVSLAAKGAKAPPTDEDGDGPQGGGSGAGGGAEPPEAT